MSISDSLPTHIVNLLLANGVLFDNEGLDPARAMTMAGRIAEKALQFLDILMWERGASSHLKEKQPSLLACAVIHAARTEEIHPIDDRNLESGATGESLDKIIRSASWPRELQSLTGWEVKDIDEVARFLIKLNL